MNFLEGVEPLPYLMITIITWECVPLVPAKLSFRRARLEVSVISIGAIVMRLQSAVVCGHCERRIEGGATSPSHQCHNPLNTRLRRYRRLALRIIAGQHGKLLAFMPSILIKDVNNHLKQTVNDYCLDTVPLPCEFSSSVSSG